MAVPGLDVTVEWGSRDEDQQDQQLWEDNWDDDNVEDDFSVQLRSVSQSWSL